MSTLALVPSRGRPDKARETLASFLEMRRDPASRLIFILDADDPTYHEYPSEYVYLATPRGSYVPALNQAAKDPAVIRDATSVGFLGDDNRCRTPGFDVILDSWLTENIGIAYGDDGIQHERLPTSWWVSRPIVDVFGMADERYRHLYPDRQWLEMGQGAGCLRYFPEVSIEHLHPLTEHGSGWATKPGIENFVDATYLRGNSRENAEQDFRAFRQWHRRDRVRDIARLRGIINSRRSQRVLADWHHPALWESLAMLFEDRFGWELYSPIGIDWTRQGWTYELTSIGWTPKDYLVFPDAQPVNGHYERREPEFPQRPRKMITVEQAQGMKWDYVLASVSVHQRPFAQLAKRFGARLIHQVGNAKHNIDRSVSQITLASASVPRHTRAITYHQEFDRTLFAPAEPSERQRVTSFMLRLDSTSCPYEWLSGSVPWSAVGGHDPKAKGYLAPMSKVAGLMRETGWVWHDKKIGDGYGHVLHNAAAMGRPLIGHASHYAGQLGAPLWRDMETCIDLDKHPPDRALRLIRAISADPDWYADMSRRASELFDATVDFDAEAERIRAALD